MRALHTVLPLFAASLPCACPPAPPGDDPPAALDAGESDAGPAVADGGGELHGDGGAPDAGAPVVDGRADGGAELNPECLGDQCGCPQETGGVTCSSGVTCTTGTQLDGGVRLACRLAKSPTSHCNPRRFDIPFTHLVGDPPFHAICGFLDFGACGGEAQVELDCGTLCLFADGGWSMASSCP